MKLAQLKKGDVLLCLPEAADDVYHVKCRVCEVTSITNSDDVRVNFHTRHGLVTNWIESVSVDRLRAFPFEVGDWCHVLKFQKKRHKIMKITGEFLYLMSEDGEYMSPVGSNYRFLRPTRASRVAKLLKELKNC
jgi:hypothetical protein